MFDRRHLYVKEQTNFRGKGRRVKIGIAKVMATRHSRVNAGLPGDWGEITDRRLFFARSTEAYLHQKYSTFHTPLNNLKPGSGGSEIFTISTHKLAILRLTLGVMAAADHFIAFSAVVICVKTPILIWYFLS
jgi:hypothetical protein